VIISVVEPVEDAAGAREGGGLQVESQQRQHSKQSYQVT